MVYETQAAFHTEASDVADVCDDPHVTVKMVEVYEKEQSIQSVIT